MNNGIMAIMAEPLANTVAGMVEGVRVCETQEEREDFAAFALDMALDMLNTAEVIELPDADFRKGIAKLFAPMFVEIITKEEAR